MNDAISETPQWDVALEALLREECQKRGEDLTLNDLRLIAAIHSVRLDDILDSLCELVQHGVWDYQGDNGVDRNLCKLLKANHRLNDEQLKRFEGLWRPVSG